MASPIASRRFAYWRTKRGLVLLKERPSRSWVTRICASQSGPAPMPMVGTWSAAVTSRAISRGTTSRTTAKAPASELDGLGAALLDEPERRPHGVVGARVISAVGHVGDQERALDAAADGARVVNHLFERDGDGRVVAEPDVPQGV